jgi:hypothetical protein
MNSSRIFARRAALGAFLALVFASGYVLGTLDARPAEAQVGDLGKDLLNQATESGGMLGSAAQLGTTITEMQTNVNELQGNIDALNKIKEALGG